MSSLNQNDPRAIHEMVRAYYAETLTGSDDLKTDCCEIIEIPPRYVTEIMSLIADEIVEKFYGCGTPVPPALEGCTVLDLGCGTGRDVFVISKLVGEKGRVIGVDMTPEQIGVAKKYQSEQAERFGHSEPNTEFYNGYIEDLAALGIEDESVDLVVSNCVINLSPFKEQIFSEIYRILKPGGELFFSDIFSDRRIPEHLQDDPVLRGECLGGAHYTEDFRRMLASTGWENFAIVDSNDVEIHDFEVQSKLKFIRFSSKTVRAVKAKGLEDREEDYGQVATYLGTMPERPRYFDFDTELRFVKDKPRAISGNTAKMLEQSRYGTHFKITKAGVHQGLFDPGSAQLAAEVRSGKRAVDLRLLEESAERSGVVPFKERVGEPSLLMAPAKPDIMQMNITYACNLLCRHCYLECRPDSPEQMSRSVMEQSLQAFKSGGFKTLDITGGSPEMNPEFEWLLRKGSELGEVIVRTNLTLLDTPRYSHLLDVFAETSPRIVASVPFFNEEGTDEQRGEGVFKRVMATIRALNDRGYGIEDSKRLDLVYNVSGPYLPMPQELIHDAYEQVLTAEQGIRFHDLLAFNNYPLGRFAHDLLDAGMLDHYQDLLAQNFNTLAVTRMMCRDQVSVDYDGRLYDCEPNHVLSLPIQIGDRDATIADIMSGPMQERPIITNPVCYSCAAGFGSSCGGSLV